jgi:hypothetical protein
LDGKRRHDWIPGVPVPVFVGLTCERLDDNMAAFLSESRFAEWLCELNSLAKVLRFFMGVPGGSKQEGTRQLERAISSGVLTPTIARIYLSLNLHRFDQQYARAIAFLAPVAEKYPTNPLFQPMLGDLHAELGRRTKHFCTIAPLLPFWSRMPPAARAFRHLLIPRRQQLQGQTLRASRSRESAIADTLNRDFIRGAARRGGRRAWRGGLAQRKRLGRLP